MDGLLNRSEVESISETAVSDHDLRRIFVGHHHGGGRQATAEGVRVIRSQGFPDHPGVVILAHLELVTTRLYNS